MGKSPQERGSVTEGSAEDPTVELDVLEQTSSIEDARALRRDRDTHGLVPSPIPKAWVLEGNPTARSKRLAVSTDQLAAAWMWDCTAGRFNWFYDDDETVHVLEGFVLVEDAAGVQQKLQAGDTFLFPAGSWYQWTVRDYVRRIAFTHPPLSRELRIIRGILRRLTAPFRRKPVAPPGSN